jgi:hypothetical protein
MNTITYAYALTIEIPDVPLPGLGGLADDLNRVGIDTTSPLTRTADGIVAAPDGITEEQIREYVVNELARDYVGKTVQITRWRLSPAGPKGRS